MTMRMRRVVTVAVSLLLVVPFVGAAQRAYTDRTNDLYNAIALNGDGPAENVIMFLGDGMGDSEITIARNYSVGAAGRMAMDGLPFTGAYTTYALNEKDPSKPDYVTDSAASGTGWSTGQKTSNGRISTSAGTDQDLTTILELAQRGGYRTGDISTAELTDATPAVLASHVTSRTCQGPKDMATCPRNTKRMGGRGSIAEQLVDHKVDVLMGGGQQRFAQATDAGPTVLDSAKAQGYTYVTDTNGMNGLQAGQPVLGLFAAGNMDLEWKGDIAKPFPGTGPQRCVENQRPGNQPSLADMTRKSLELLQRPTGQKGFFLQVEGASIDKQDHVENPCAQIGETIAFDQAIQVGLDFAKTHPRTLIIVTADHGHTSQIIDPPTKNTHPGAFSKLVTKDGAEMTINYATAPDGESQSHTGTQVRIAAQGPKGANVVGTIDQTDLFRIFVDALGLG